MYFFLYQSTFMLFFVVAIIRTFLYTSNFVKIRNPI